MLQLVNFFVCVSLALPWILVKLRHWQRQLQIYQAPLQIGARPPLNMKACSTHTYERPGLMGNEGWRQRELQIWLAPLGRAHLVPEISMTTLRHLVGVCRNTKNKVQPELTTPDLRNRHDRK